MTAENSKNMPYSYIFIIKRMVYRKRASVASSRDKILVVRAVVGGGGLTGHQYGGLELQGDILAHVLHKQGIGSKNCLKLAHFFHCRCVGSINDATVGWTAVPDQIMFMSYLRLIVGFVGQLSNRRTGLPWLVQPGRSSLCEHNTKSLSLA